MIQKVWQLCIETQISSSKGQDGTGNPESSAVNEYKLEFEVSPLASSTNSRARTPTVDRSQGLFPSTNNLEYEIK